MKQPIILIILGIILLSSFTFGKLGDTNRLFYFNMTDDCKDEWSSKDFTSSGVDFTGNGGVFASTDYCEYTSDGTILITGTSSDFTICTKFKFNTLSGASMLWDEKGVSFGTKLVVKDDGSGYRINQGFWGIADAYYNAPRTIVTDVNYTYCTVYNGATDNGEMILNNTNLTGFNNGARTSEETHIQIGANKEGTASRNTFFNGVIYNLCGWNRSLTQAELTEYFIYGCNGNTIVSNPALFIVTNMSSYTNYGLNRISFNWSVTEQDTSINNVNCSLIINNVRNQTFNNYAVDTYPDFINVYNFSVNFGNVEKEFNMSLACRDYAGTNVYINTSKYKIIVDTKAPQISNTFSRPENVSVLNLVNEKLKINSTITDLYSGVNNAYVNLFLSKIAIYYNGTLINGNNSYAYDTHQSNKFGWVFDEHEFLGGTYPLDPDYTENTPHLNFTFQGTNKILKYRFANINGKIQSNFVEDMISPIGAVSNSNYYYCNSTYTTGNPQTSNFCSLFASVPNNYGIAHNHNKSFHRIISLGINTTSEKIGNIKITPISYILKTGSTTGEVVYYVNKVSRYNFNTLSSNNGNTYSNLAYTIDVHIHQIESNAEILFSVCGVDNNLNTNCTAQYSNFISFPDIPPTGVNFFNPIVGGVYENSIKINHTDSISPSGNDISTYQYYYTLTETEDYKFITSLDQTTHNTYTWNISTITNGDYILKLIISDNVGQETTQYINFFTINNPLSLTENLLTNIDETLTSIEGGINMLWIVFLYIALLVTGFYMIKSGNVLFGQGLLFSSIGFDFFFVVKLFNDYIKDNMTDDLTGYSLTIFGFLLGSVLIVKIAFIIFAKYTIMQKNKD